MKTLTNDEVRVLVELCTMREVEAWMCEDCPLEKECRYHTKGERCGSVLEGEQE